ncbi:MAG: hypothetical protein PHI02_09170 [Sulfurovaceae bacterium]|nr:hypothetical protein [Sulfurovaceae bacterium]
MKRVFIYGLVALEYVGTIDLPCRFLVHNKKHPVLKTGDIIFVDETTAVFAVRSGNYKKVDVADADISNLFIEDETAPAIGTPPAAGTITGGITKIAKTAIDKLKGN